jgi:hypothetical protein
MSEADSASDLYEEPDSDYLASELQAAEKEAGFDDPREGEEDDFEVLGHGLRVAELKRRPALHPASARTMKRSSRGRSGLQASRKNTSRSGR